MLYLFCFFLVLGLICASDHSKVRRTHRHHHRRDADSFEDSFFDASLNKRADLLSASEDHFSFQFYERQSKRHQGRRHYFALDERPLQEPISNEKQRREEKRTRRHHHHGKNRRQRKTRKMERWQQSKDEDSATQIWYRQKDEKAPLRYDPECRQHEGDIVVSFSAKESPRHRQAVDVLSID